MVVCIFNHRLHITVNNILATCINSQQTASGKLNRICQCIPTTILMSQPYSHLEEFYSKFAIFSICPWDGRHDGGFTHHPCVSHLISHQLRVRVELSFRHVTPARGPLTGQHEGAQTVQAVDQHTVLKQK